jgi:hypothetical protein
MTWYSWPSVAAFNAWHDTVIAGLGLPWIGINQNTGELEPSKQQTTSYTSAIHVGYADWRAPVSQYVADSHPDGLGLLSEPPPYDEEII